MALTEIEAQAVNAVLTWILGVRDDDRAEPTAWAAQEAAELLADRAHKTLGCGLDGDEVNTAWRDLLLPAFTTSAGGVNAAPHACVPAMDGHDDPGAGLPAPGPSRTSAAGGTPQETCHG